MKVLLKLFVCFLFFIQSNIVFGDVTLPSVIGNNMVLQQNKPIQLWGWAEPGESVSIEINNNKEKAKTDDNGKWNITMPAMKAGGPFKMEIKGNNTIELTNVLVGEVWICSGQSNMEWSINNGIDDGDAVAAAADDPRIRFFDVPNVIGLKPQHDCGGSWTTCTPETVRAFSAVGYLFGRELRKELDVPIGLIAPNWGGTVAEAWTSEKTLRKLGDFNAALDAIAREVADPEAAENQYREKVQRWWSRLESMDSGIKENWASPNFDDSSWPTCTVPVGWDIDELRDFDGAAWFRTTFEITPDWTNKELTLLLGPIDDMDTVWLNGTKIGGIEEMGRWYQPREYKVAADLVKPGRNVLAVRVVDTMGAGGMCGKPEAVALRANGDGKETIELAGQWRYHTSVEMEKMPKWPRRLDNPNLPTVLSNGMLEPLIPFGIRGAIWYQGESNRTRAKQYQTLFPAMIADWRQRWGQGDFPFYYVQIAPFRYENDQGQAAELREAQMMTLRAPQTGMVVTMDIGNPDNIHPRNKQEVGRRLALWALAKTYERENIVFSGPLYKSMKIEGDRIRISFDHAEGLKTRDGAPPTCFTIAGADRQFHPATATIEGDTIVVSCAQVSQPIAVRYAWGTADQPNLCNGAGLPASSFRTDDWPRPANTPY